MKKLFSTFVFILFFFLQFTLEVDNCNAQWTQMNYNLWSKDIRSFASSGDTIFASTPSDGYLYKSINSGTNWTQISEIRPYAYYNNTLIWTGNEILVAGGSASYRSTNRGLNWININMWSYTLASSGNTIFAGQNPYIYLTTNNGVSWVQTTFTIRPYSLMMNNNNVLAGVSGGVYLSSDNGITWVNTLVTSNTVVSLLKSGSNIFAGSSGGIYVSTNGGFNWTQLTTNNTTNLTLFGSDIYSSVVIGSNQELQKSTNNGLNWSQIYVTTRNIQCITVLQGKYYLGTSAGYISSTDNGITWFAAQPSNIGVIKQSGNNLYAGTTEGLFISTDGGLKWTTKNFAQNIYSLLIYGNNMVAGTAGSGVYVSTNNGDNWVQTSLNNKVVNSLVKKDVYIIAATNTNGVYYSTNDGTNWTQSSINNLTTNALYILDTNVYAGTNIGGVYISSNNGVNWTPTSLIYKDIYSLFNEGNKLYAGSSNTGVYLTTNQGMNWTQSSFTTSGIVSYSSYGSSIFAGTNGVGVYLTKNSGINWMQSNDGMSNQNVRALSTWGNYIIAGTAGNGFYRRYILEFAPIRGDANLDSTVNVLDVTSDVNYILGNPPVPFSVLAADVNTDLVVNVLDVVGTVNIILHPTFKMFAHNEQTDNSGTASLYIQNNSLKLQNTVPVAGIQYKLSGAGAQNVTFTPSSELTNYQVVSGAKSDTAKTFIIFTMSDTSINSGVHTLGTFTGLNSGISMNEVFIADGNGNGILTSNEENGNTEIPKDYVLNQNYPNPFNSTSNLKFEIANLGYTKVVLYDVMGREIQTLVNKTLKPGKYEIFIDGSNLSSGVYFYKLTSGSYTATKKMIVLK